MAPDQTPRGAPNSTQPSSGSSDAAPFLLGKLRSMRPPTRAPAPTPNPVPQRRDTGARGATGATGVTGANANGPRRQAVGHPDVNYHPSRQSPSPHVERRPEGQPLPAPIASNLAAILPRHQPVPETDPARVSSAERPVQVTIGRVEVRAVQPSVGRATPPSATPSMTLDEYLRGRSGAER